jgi:hypothetical protein
MKKGGDGQGNGKQGDELAPAPTAAPVQRRRTPEPGPVINSGA